MMPKEPQRCKHDLIEGTCSLCLGMKQTGSNGLFSSAPSYIRPNSFYALTSNRGRLPSGADAGHDPNWDE